jgi:hypothetical protein
MMYDFERAKLLEPYEERFGELQDTFMARNQKPFILESRLRRSSRRAGYSVFKKAVHTLINPYPIHVHPASKERSIGQVQDILQEIGETVLNSGDRVARLRLTVPLPRPLLPSIGSESLYS